MTTIIDTNVLIDLLDEDSEHHQWCREAFDDAKTAGPVIIPDIAYSELSVGMDTREDTDQAITDLALERFACSDDSLFSAGKAFLKYRDENGGNKSNVLPDFLIGAQAHAEGLPILTRDTKRFKSYFPEVKLICPPKKKKSS